MSSKLACAPSTIRRHLGYWVGQGVLREDHNDTFTVIERQTEAIKSCPTGMARKECYACAVTCIVRSLVNKIIRSQAMCC